MAVPAPNLKRKSIDELFDLLSAGMVSSPMHQQASFMLQIRIGEKQAQAYGVTRERIRQVEMMALKKLSRAQRRERLAGFMSG